jgi:hypothetical protein
MQHTTQHDLATAIHDALFTDVNGYALSSLDRTNKTECNNADFTYGEVTPESVRRIIDMLPVKTGTFCDLGSGTGKAVVLAPVLGQFTHSIGVELLPNLHDTAASVGQRYEKEIKPTLPEAMRNHTLEYRNEDIFLTDLSNVDVVLAHCTTCFAEDTMRRFTKKCEETRPGTHLACISRRLESDCFEQIMVDSCSMGWGTATVYVYRRK